MSKHIIILTIPGIGTHKKGYSNEFQEDLEKFSKNTSLRGNYTVLETLPFAITSIDANQKRLFSRLEAENKLGGILSLRRLVLEAFGDGVAFEHNACRKDSSYHRIHLYLKKEIEKANKLKENYDQAELVILASSIGCHLLSTYIWDCDKGGGVFEYTPITADNNLKNLRYLATIGCNIPLFVSGLDENQIKSIETRNPKFTWDNYYDRDDVLGWPLQQLSDTYNELVTDHEINTGLYIGSHVRYWDDNDFTKPFTAKMVEIFEGM